MPPATLAPPVASTPPAGHANAASPSKSLVDFDKTFSDLDDAPPAPEPTQEPKTEPTEPTKEPAKTEPKEEPKPEPAKEPLKDPATGKFTKAEPKTEPKHDPEDDVQDEFTPPSTATGSQLRSFARNAGKKARGFRNRVSQLETEVQKLKTAPQGDSSALAQQLAAANQRIQQYENEAKLTRYERSEEYRSKYEQPYQNAVKQAYSDVQELLVSVPKPTEEDPNATQEREATPDDFDEIYGLPLGPASRLAKQKFGDQAGIVLQHRQAIKNAAKLALDAIETNKGNATKYEQEQTTAQKMRQEAQNQMFNSVIEDLQTKYPNRFGELEPTHEFSKEWNEQRSQGLSMADMAFDAEERAKLSPQQNAILDGQVHLRAAHYPAEHKLRMYWETKAKEYLSELEQIRGSGPGKPKTTTTTASSNGKRKSWAAEFDEKVGSD